MDDNPCAFSGLLVGNQPLGKIVVRITYASVRAAGRVCSVAFGKGRAGERKKDGDMPGNSSLSRRPHIRGSIVK
ncbi:hypothetical protein HUJ05_009139 [Dendroctonus ponderosae]|nr:hypothetical protein HUJ05_009139 [Dendroctonus ponderosae]